jgi:hypothetical protein
MSFIDEKFWELKQAAKWSLQVHEKKRAIAHLLHDYGRGALPALLEIRETTVYEEIKEACADAIKSAKIRADKSVDRVAVQKYSIHNKARRLSKRKKKGRKV